MKSQRILFVTAGMLALIAMLTGRGNAQASVPNLVQVPMVTSLAGVPATTYMGTVANANCTSSAPGYLDSNGNGCPANQALLQNVYNVAVDSSGDVASANATTFGIRVVYEGGSTMAGMITGALPGYSFTPIVGHSYLLTEGTVIAALTKQSNGSYYCQNNSAFGVALNSLGDGCPGQYVGASARVVAFDPDGNLFFGGINPLPVIHVIYAGGVRAANLINAYNPAVAAAGGPKVGYVYGLSTGATGSTDFVTLGGIAIQAVSATQENLFVADRGASTTETGILTSPSGNQIKEFVCPAGTTGCNTSVNGTTYSSVGWATYIAGTTTTGQAGDGGPVAQAQIGTPYTLQFDSLGDLFLGDTLNDRVRVVYNGGTSLPLYANNVHITSPIIGNIYTVAGFGVTGGTRVSPAAANTLAVAPANFGVDANGDLYFVGGSFLWVDSAATGQAVAIGWMNATSSGYSVTASPQAGVYCNGAGSGPTMSDVYADGCPATEVRPDAEQASVIPFDPQGNFYIAEARTTTTASAMVHKYSYGNRFGTAAAGTSTVQSLAFTPSTLSGTYTPTLPPTYTSAEFTDAGGDVCTTGTAGITTQTCVVNVTFKPVLAGPRTGSVSLVQSGTTLPTVLLSGAGTGAQIALDPATTTTIGTGLQPSGVAIDPRGNTYISSGGSTGVVLKSSSGGTPAAFTTGLNHPSQLALDGAGNVYVADSSNNRIAVVPPAGGAATAFLGGSFTVVNTSTLPYAISTGQSLNNPSGIAVDQNGDVYIADTGNNRVLEATVAFNGLANPILQLNLSGLSSPKSIAVDAAGNVFVADSGNHRIVELSAAGIQSVASSSYTPSLSNPVGVAVDAASNLYVADAGNQQVVLLPAGGAIAIPLLINSTGLAGVAADSIGNVYAADSAAGHVTQLNRTSPSYAFTQDIAVGDSSSSQSVTVTNTGYPGSTLAFGSPLSVQSDLQPDFLVSSSTGNGCTVNGSLVSGQQCGLSVTFQPQSINSFTSTVTFPHSNAVNPASLMVSGHSDKLGLSYKLLSPGTTSGTMNTQITATLTADTTSTLGGTISFVIDGGTPVLAAVSGGTATITVPLTAGSHTVTASYAGADTNSLTFTVVPGISGVNLSYTPTAPTFGQTVTVTAAIVTSNSPQTPTGTVTFTVNGVAQTPVPYAPTEQLTLNLLPIGTTNVSASYSGDSNYSANSSAVSISIGRAPTTTALAVISNVATGGNTITLTATVTPQFSIPAGGSVTFTYAGTTTSAIPLVNGTATFTTATSQLSAYTFTATYSGDINYLGSLKTVTPTAILVETLASSSLTVPQNAQIAENLRLDSFFGYAGGMIQVSCTGLPANTVCTMSPAGGIVLGANSSQTVQLLITTNASPAAVKSAQLNKPDAGAPLLFAGGLGLFVCLALPWWKQRRYFTGLLMTIFMMGCALAITGCGNGSMNTVYATPTGTYIIHVVATDGTITITQPLSLTIVPGTTDARP